MPNSPHPDLRLDVPTPSTPPSQRARSTSPSRGTPLRGPSRPLSPNPSYTASPRLNQSPNPNRDSGFEPIGGGSGISGIGRAFAQRTLRAVRRGNLPFMLVFVSYVLLTESGVD
jgi:hypothetical protein